MSECATIIHLKELAYSHQGKVIAAAALNALRVIPDVDSPSRDSSSIKLLNTLVSAIYRANDASLLVHLKQGEADCETCAAMQKELSSRESH